MDINRVKKPLNQFIKKASQAISVDEVIVFGSYLEGNASDDSDIDVLIVSDDFKYLDEDRRFKILYTASSKIEPDIHPWAFTKKELNQASRLTLWGYVRDHGKHFDPKMLSS